MSRVLAVLRNGSWLTRDRVRLVAAAALAFSLVTLGALVFTAHGLVDMMDRPLGTDFSSFHAAGRAVLDGHPGDPFDPPAHFLRQQALFGPNTPFYGWLYPPLFLFVAAPLALVPYGLALLVWQGATLAFYLVVIGAIVRRETATLPVAEAGIARGLWLLLALAYPAVFVNIGHGQNGFLSAALFGGALLLLDKRPVIAGILVGLLAYKPQLGLLIPFALVAGGYWRTIAAAALTVAALAGASLLAFGVEAWRGFFASAAYSRTELLEAGGPGFEKAQSVFAAVRMWGGSVALAYAAQAIVTVLVAVLLVRLWRSRAPLARKAAALLLAAVLGTPFSLDYDLMILAPAIAWLALDGLRHGFRPYEASALAFLWLVPLIARSIAGATAVPVGVIAVAIVFLSISAGFSDRYPSKGGS